VSLSQCNFREWGLKDESIPAVEVLGGDLTVLGCIFARDRAHIRVGPEAGPPILDNNRFKGEPKVEILNQAGSGKP